MMNEITAGSVGRIQRIVHRSWSCMLFILALLWATGCTPKRTDPIRLWVSAQDSGSGSWLGLGQTVTLWAARNETISMRLVFEADRLLSSPTVQIHHHDSTGSGAMTTAIYRIGDIHIGRFPEWQARGALASRKKRRVTDVLIPIDAPRGGMPPALARGESLDLWIDIDIDKNASGGTHRFDVVISDSGKPVANGPVAVTVWPFTLPDLPRETLLAGVVSKHESIAENLQGTMQLLRDHRLTPIIVDARPELDVILPGDVRVNWLNYDRIVEPFVLGDAYTTRRPSKYWPIPFDEMFPEPPEYEPQESPTYAAVVRSYLENAADHFERRGWLDQSFVVLPFVEPANGESAAGEEIVEYFTSLVSDADPRLSVIAPLPPKSMPVNLHDSVAAWSPFAEHYAPEQMFRQRQLGRKSWFQMGDPPFSGTTEICGVTGAAEIIPWQARKYDAVCVDLGIVNDWPTGANLKTPQQIANQSPRSLIYPGAAFGLSLPVETVRLKRVRRGMQDLAYLDLLRDAGLSHVADSVMESICRYAMTDAASGGIGDGRSLGWPPEEETWTEARRIMADGLLRERGGGEADKLRETLRWQQFMGQTRQVTLDTQGVRVRRADREEFAFRIVFVIRVANGGRRPIRGTLAINPLPPGWVVDPESTQLDRLGENESAVAHMIVHAPDLPPMANGWTEVNIIMRDQLEQEYESKARLAVLAAVPAESPITIDANVGDWSFVHAPRGSGFRAIGNPGTPATTTSFYAAHDDDHLYVLFDSTMTSPHSDHWMEILIDPSNTETRSTTSLHRIRVTPNGDVQYNRGADDSECSFRSSIEQGIWIGELAIPLDLISSGSLAGRGIIAFDVIRSDGANEQKSRWAGSSPKWDQPTSLGNLMITPAD